MNPAQNPIPAQPGAPAPAGMSLDDVVYTLFRHKWLILAFVMLGLVGVVAVSFLKPPLYLSKAQVLVRYVENRAAVGPEAEKSIRPMGEDSYSAIRSEMEVLKSLDVALRAVEAVGPEKVLAHWGGGTNRMVAAGVISSGIEVVVPPNTMILDVTFRHPEEAVVQPVLDAVIQAYKRKHVEVRSGGGVILTFFTNQVHGLGENLARLEEELKVEKAKANVLFLDDTKKSYQTQISRIQNELFDAQRELAESRAVLGGMTEPGSITNSEPSLDLAVPADAVSDYSFAVTELETLKRRERELLLQYKEAYPLVEQVRGQIATLTQQKRDLEAKYKSLTLLGSGSSSGSRSATNSLGGNLKSDVNDIKRLTVRVAILGTLLSNIQAQASHVLDVEPRIAQLQRQRDEAQRAYDYFMDKVGDSRRAAGEGINISEVENPTPPGLDTKKFKKLVGIVLAGCIGLGFGLAFLIEMFLDRTIKRAVDVERHLRIPVLLTIPDTAWTGRMRLPWWLGGRRAGVGNHDGGGANTSTAVVRWSASDAIQSFTQGLRERLVTHFEIRNLSLKKPKLVAVTGCGGGSGVTTLAGGLATELSRTGDGNVLLVDMNSGGGVARSYHHGKPGAGMTDVEGAIPAEDAEDGGDLPFATVAEGGKSDKIMRLGPSNFGHLMPKLKASDYDYIIFDMPPVTPTSATPRFASHMDLVLFVLEAEKTGQTAAKRASALMRESKVNVAAVLNKFRPHVPVSLAQDD